MSWNFLVKPSISLNEGIQEEKSPQANVFVYNNALFFSTQSLFLNKRIFIVQIKRMMAVILFNK